MHTPVPASAIGAEAPTSRSVFRLLVREIGATNRDADSLRLALLSQWSDDGGTYELVHLITMLDEADPEGDEGVEARLAMWFELADPGDGQLVAADDPLLVGLSDDFRNRLIAIARP